MQNVEFMSVKQNFMFCEKKNQFLKMESFYLAIITVCIILGPFTLLILVLALTKLVLKCIRRYNKRNELPVTMRYTGCRQVSRRTIHHGHFPAQPTRSVLQPPHRFRPGTFENQNETRSDRCCSYNFEENTKKDIKSSTRYNKKQRNRKKLSCPLCRVDSTIDFANLQLIYNVKQKCNICDTTEANLFLPQCGHLCMCVKCGRKWAKKL